MSSIQNVIRAELDPLKPVPELCSVIAAVLQYHPGKEKEVLDGLSAAVQGHIKKLKGDELKDDKPIRQSGRHEED